MGYHAVKRPPTLGSILVGAPVNAECMRESISALQIASGEALKRTTWRISLLEHHQSLPRHFDCRGYHIRGQHGLALTALSASRDSAAK
jgi:hypothetical protein